MTDRPPHTELDTEADGCPPAAPVVLRLMTAGLEDARPREAPAETPESGTPRAPRPSAAGPCPSRRWLRVRDLIAEYGMSQSAAYRLKRFVTWTKRPGFGVLFPRAEVEAYLAAGLHEPAAAPGACPVPRPRPPGSKAPRGKGPEPSWVADARRFGLW